MTKEESEHWPAWKIGASGLVAAVFSLALYPLDIRYWHTYGAYFTETFVDNIDFLTSDLCIQLAYDSMGIVRHFHWFSKWIYQLPLVFIVMSVLLKVVEVVIVYHILRCLRFGARASLLLSTIFLFILGLQGTAPNGLFGPPDYNKAFVSALLSLLGIYAILRDRNGWAGVLLGSACYFHIPYGLTALAFLGSGQLARSWMIRNYHRLFWFVGTALVTLIPVMIQLSGVDGGNATRLSMGGWYSYVTGWGFWGADALFVPWIFSDVFIFTVLATVYFLWRPRDEVTSVLDVYILSGFVLSGLCLLLDSLHGEGIFLGRISEVFISVQMRRGLWIPFFMLVIGCFRFLWQSADEPRLSWRWLFASLTMLFLLRPLYVWGLFIAFAAAIYIWQQRRFWAWYLCPLLIVIGLGMRLLFLSRQDVLFVSVPRHILFPLVVALIAVSIPRLRRGGGLVRVGLVVMLVVAPLIASELPTWYEDSQWLTRHGWMSPISQIELLSQLQIRENSPALTVDSSAYSVLQALQRINPQKDMVFYPWSLGILDGQIPGMFAPFPCQNMAISSYAGVSIIHNFAESVYGHTIDPRDLFKARQMEEIHNAMTVERIRTLFARGRMSWFISKRLYLELPTEEQVGEYYIYRNPL